jgi:ssDNA-binding Zn-finger/Zn-ribbon topoisomerase 1
MSFQYEKTLCPDCNGEMISRTGKFGVFWGCKKFPECKGTRDSQGRSKADRTKWKNEQTKTTDSIDLVNSDSVGENYEHDEKDEFNRFSFKRTR